MPDELSSKRDRLLDLLRGLGSCAVAFSGGLDSAVLAKAARIALGDRAMAVLGRSASLAAGELDAARRLAAEIGIHLEVVETDELNIPAYQANQTDRCYHCKTELFRCVEQRARQRNLAAVVDGTNHDDLGDYRPGLRAVKERHVRSPLAECGLTKAEIRRLAELWELPIWNKPATPCLSSRVAYGQRITPERLTMIDQAERFLRERGFQPLRVRYHPGDVARVEVSLEQLPRLVEPELRREVVERLRSLGFQYVSLDLEGFRSGSMNAGIEGLGIRD
ncbi:MAG: ATP-dependent sacrificial sulfur transferase LarE [Thermoguttaceae bacterium]